MARDRPDRSPRLDQPREVKRGPFTRPQMDPDTFAAAYKKMLTDAQRCI